MQIGFGRPINGCAEGASAYSFTQLGEQFGEECLTHIMAMMLHMI